MSQENTNQETNEAQEREAESTGTSKEEVTSEDKTVAGDGGQEIPVSDEDETGEENQGTASGGETGEESQAESVEDSGETEGETKKSFFGKKKSKLEEKVAQLEDARMRQLAEFENFRKRSEKEKSQMFEVGAKSVVEKILPVLDNFERGLAGVEEKTPFVEGMEMVYKQMLGALDEMGVKPIEALGQPFDPNYHNAVMTVEDETKESGTVAEELQKGYLYQDSVVRHSMVKVVS